MNITKMCAGVSNPVQDVARNLTMIKMNALKIPNVQTVGRTIQLMLQHAQYEKKHSEVEPHRGSLLCRDQENHRSSISKKDL